MATVVFSTTVKDSDKDGLLDLWETATAANPVKDPNGNSLPFLGSVALGSDPAVRDIFVEIDYMKGSDGHSHLPTQPALDLVGNAFNKQGIHIHFDVGQNYQTNPPDPYVLPPGASSIGGGQILDETLCDPADPTCIFPAVAGTVRWKTGFDYIKNGSVKNSKNGDPALPAHFDPTRKDIFHYVVSAHTMFLPKWIVNDTSLTSISVSGGIATVTTAVPHGLTAGNLVTVSGAPAGSGLNFNAYNVLAVGPGASPTTFTFTTTAPDGGPYKNWGLGVGNGVPRSVSGVSDVGGGDLMITLGLWDNSVGSDFIQASTLMHELGHNLALGHGGDLAEPNCKPNYQSIMSYLFQVRGLLLPDGSPHIDYSGQVLEQLDETNLSESSGFNILPSLAPGYSPSLLSYMPRWYAPLGTLATGRFPGSDDRDVAGNKALRRYTSADVLRRCSLPYASTEQLS